MQLMVKVSTDLLLQLISVTVQEILMQNFTVKILHQILERIMVLSDEMMIIWLIIGIIFLFILKME